MRGTGSGFLWGSVVSIVALAALSLMLPLPGSTPRAPSPEDVAAARAEAEAQIKVIPSSDAEREMALEDSLEEDAEATTPAEPTDPLLEPTTTEAPEPASPAPVEEEVQPASSEATAPAPEATAPAPTSEPSATPEPAVTAQPTPAPEVDVEPSVETAQPAVTEAVPEAETTQTAAKVSASLPEVGGDNAAPVQADTPLVKYARPFKAAGGQPIFVMLLTDSGAEGVDREGLAALPFPVSFVIDPAMKDATRIASIYRKAGQEVVMLASGIPEGAEAADIEQSFQANAAALPEAVAVMDLPGGGFQDNRPLAGLVVPVIGAQGRGIVSFDHGLNAAEQVARREGVPHAKVFRQLDAAGEDAETIRRSLDRAAFKAAQEGSVVVLGSVNSELVATLLAWTVEGRGAGVAMAPLSAVLTTE